MTTPLSLLPKARSTTLRHTCGTMPCTLRIGTFIGKPCASGTVVGVHLDGIAPAIGKGTSTKVSDLNIAAGCMVCHDLLARVDPAWMVLLDKYPAAVQRQIHQAHMETLARWLECGAIEIPDGEIV